MVKNFALQEYLAKKYEGTRSLTISTDWNPNRMVGMPGLVIDPGFPSLIGTVSSISTSISATGRAASTVVFRGVRVIYDEDEEAYQKPEESIYKDAIKPSYTEIFPTLHDSIYDGNLYKYGVIGKDIYTYMTQGTKTSDSYLKELADSSEKDEKHPWKVTRNSFDNENMTTAPNEDYSILSK